MTIECLATCDGHAITLEHLKNHLRLIECVEDYYLEELIRVATSVLENYLQRSILFKTYKLIHSRSLPSCTHQGMQSMDLPYPPLTKIISVHELLPHDEKRPLKRYILTPNNSRPRLSVWGSAIEVIYQAGYGDKASDIPPPLRHAITVIAAEMYSKRIDEGVQKNAIPASLDLLLGIANVRLL